MRVQELAHGYYAVIRWVLPLVAVFFVFMLKKLLIFKLPQPPLLANLRLDDGTLLPVHSCESTIGRGKNCEICLPLRTISRQHAVLTYSEGFFRICDTRSRGGVLVNGESAGGGRWLEYGDVIDISGTKLVLVAPEEETSRDIYSRSVSSAKKKEKKHAFKQPSPVAALIFLTLFQGLVMLQMLLTREEYTAEILLAFCGLCGLSWSYSLVSKSFTKTAPGPEIAAFFLSTLGLCVTASAEPGDIVKQFIAIIAGLILMGIIGLVLSNLKLTMKLRYVAGAGALALLAVNLIIGEVRNGAKNWINLGFITIQPSEFIKIAFIFASAVTLDWLLSRKNLAMLMIFSAACIGMLFMMQDFGTALIFFVTFLIIAYLSSGNILLIGGVSAVAAAGAGIIVSIKPYILQRFAAWRHVFEYANSTGFQQSRTLIAISGGGLLGLGGGCGFLRKIVASDTDLVFGIISEEWGFLAALCSAACIVLLLAGAIHNAKAASSSYYAIAGCAAAGMFLFQSSLNLFGSTDLLPLTGVTYVFVSNGGSSLVACWGMIAFIKAIYRHRTGARISSY